MTVRMHGRELDTQGRHAPELVVTLDYSVGRMPGTHDAGSPPSIYGSLRAEQIARPGHVLT